jgi:hypothetical protein
MLTQLVRDADGNLLILGKQRSEVIVDANKRLAAMWDKHRMRGRSRMVAELPMLDYWRLKRQGIIDDPIALLQWLDRPDTKYYRVDGGGRLANPARSYAHVR